LDYTRRLFETTKFNFRAYWYFFDNHSTDGTQQWLEEIGGRDDVCVSLHAKNQGCAASWNCGLNYAFDQAAIPAVAVLNNDSLLHPAALDLMLEVIRSKRYHFVTATNKSAECAKPEDIFTLKVPEESKFEEAPDFSCFMMDALCWRLVGKFDDRFYPAYFEDNDYHYRAKLKGEKLAKYNRALYFHYGSRTLKENSVIEVLVSSTYLENEDYFVRKWGGKPGSEQFTKPFDGRGPKR
jgi:GT2 family glycosyltransferase